MRNLRSNKIAFQTLHVDRFALDTSRPLSLGGDELELSTFVNSSTSANTYSSHSNLPIRSIPFIEDASCFVIRIDNGKDEARLQEKRGGQK